MDTLKVYVNGEIVPAEDARLSVWDGGFQSGDAVYEGMRVYNRCVYRLYEHLRRLYDCAHAIGIQVPIAIDAMADAVRRTVRENGFTDDAHIRVTVTRGTKRITGMDPRIPLTHGPNIVILAEPKTPAFHKNGIALITSSLRRMPAQCLDPKLHSCNQLGQILAKMEAVNAGGDEALMLDLHGFVAETNSANVFIVKGNRLATPRRDACMPGITRAHVLRIGASLGWDTHEENLSLTDVYTADEMFMTGTVCEIVPVTKVDGRRIGDGEPGDRTLEILGQYLRSARSEGIPVG